MRHSSLRAAVIGIAILAVSFAGSAMGAEVLKIGAAASPPHPILDALDEFSRLVEQRTKGTVEVQVFPSGQLGGEKEVSEGMRLGSIEGGSLALAALQTWVPEAAVFDMPFLFKNDKHALDVYSGAIGDDVAGKFTPQGFRVLSFTLSGSRNLFSTFEISQPSDVSGHRMRTLQSPLHIAIWSLLGANPTPIAHPEVYTALQTGVVEIADNTPISYFNEKWYEVAPNYLATRHIYAIGCICLSEVVWQRLSSENQKILLEAAKEVAAKQHQAIIDQETTSLAAAEAAGATVLHPKNLSAWSELMNPIWAEWIGEDVWRKSVIESIVAQ